MQLQNLSPRPTPWKSSLPKCGLFQGQIGVECGKVVLW